MGDNGGLDTAEVPQDAEAEGVGAVSEPATVERQNEDAEPNDPQTALRKRTTSKAAHTRQLNKVRAAIRRGATSDELDVLCEKLFDFYENCVSYHFRYCALSKREDENWIPRLESEYNDVHEKVRSYLDALGGPEALSSPAGSNNSRGAANLQETAQDIDIDRRSIRSVVSSVTNRNSIRSVVRNEANVPMATQHDAPPPRARGGGGETLVPFPAAIEPVVVIS